MTEVTSEVAVNAIQSLKEIGRRNRQRLFYMLFPDEDREKPAWLDQIDGGDNNLIYARDKYPRHLEFFKAGAEYRERCFMAGNRIGKTLAAGGYELAAHLTGEYPEWWEGKRFTRPIRAWAAGKTNETTRDILQKTLLGEIVGGGSGKHFDGTGIVPGHAVLPQISWKQGVPNLVDEIKIKHKPTGRTSTLGFKSYQQGRGSFEGTAQHVVLLDEEPPMDIYNECLIRTTTTAGVTMITFTPLDGLSEVVKQFLPQTQEMSVA